MTHEEIRASLDEFAAGRTEGAAHEAIRRHLDGCAGCRGLVDTWTTFAELLDDEALHPTAELLAAAAVGPIDPEAPEQAQLERHLEGCAPCRQQLALTRQAISGARQPRPLGSVHQPASRPVRRLSPRLAWAASLFIAAVVAGSLAFLQREPASFPREPASSQQVILGDLEGTRLIEAPGPLVANRVAIQPGAAITLRSGGSVAFGEGFSVGDDASLVVEVSPTGSAYKGTDS